jgi:TonB family protein
MGVNSFPLMAGPQAPKDSPGVTVQTDESKVLHRAPVHYPEDALSKGIQGTVVLEATLDQSGAVVDAQVVSGPPELRKAALESVLQWHFNRDLVAASKTRVAIDFALPGAGAPAKVKRVAPVMEGPVRSVDVTRLPQPLRDKVTSALTLRAGDTFNADAEQRLRAALAGIDEHLQISTGRAVDGGVALRIELENAHGMAPQRIRVGGNVQAANIVEKVVPKYPPEAKEQRIQGTVRFTATIGKDGHVISLDLVSGEPILADAAREAVQQWVYKPTLLNGEPVEVVTQIDVNFTLSK